jgi:16S rRNA (adenine1518-N6/adenine1519-N6)-dimethyltransferase
MQPVRPKKHLGQHFLLDKKIAENIVQLLTGFGGYRAVLEIGPGTGILTRFLLQNATYQTYVIDIDRESVDYLKRQIDLPETQIIRGDFLRMDLASIVPGQPLALIGNLPYNISSQIFFKLLENRALVPEMVCMIQKEVAERIAAKHGSKTYGILSVLLQAFYDIKYEFTVHEDVFDPPPKVKSGVISLRRNNVTELPCPERLFVNVVKAGFNQRRKTLRNALSGLIPKNPQTEAMLQQPVFGQRAEQLSVADFISLTLLVQQMNATT